MESGTLSIHLFLIEMLTTQLKISRRMIKVRQVPNGTSTMSVEVGAW